jgi:probable phosphoglycerate mutase
MARSPTRLWLVRHGETEGQSSVRFHGKNDVSLSDLGRQQVRALAPMFQGIAPALVVHSTLQRAAESAALLAQGCGWPAGVLRADARLQEISFGHCEGMTAEEIAAAFPAFWAERQNGSVEAFPGGEPRSEFSARVVAAVSSLLAGGPEGDVVLVAHRGTVRQTLRHLLGLPAAQPDPLPQFGVRLGSLSVACRQDAWQIELLDFVP